MLHLAKEENVLEHSGMVALLAMYISEQINKDGGETSIESILKKALLHDMQESITGDICSPMKYSSKDLQKIVEEQEFIAMSKISIDIDSNSVMDAWMKSDDVGTCEIVNFCDSLCVLLKFHDEIICRGNLAIKHSISLRLIDGLRDKLNKIHLIFPASINLFTEIENDFNKLWSEIHEDS